MTIVAFKRYTPGLVGKPKQKKAHRTFRLSRLKPGDELLPYLILFCISFSFIFWNYWQPNLSIWDEAYFVPFAQKYLTHRFYLDGHPPLGYLLIALSGWLNHTPIIPELLDINRLADLGDAVPAIDYWQYRTIPVAIATLLPLMLYSNFLLLTGNQLWSFLLALFPIFDNALLVQQRAAMLDSTLLFLCAGAFHAFIRIIQLPKHQPLNPKVQLRIYQRFGNTIGYQRLNNLLNLGLWSCLLGAAIGAACCTKMNAIFLTGLIMILSRRFEGTWRWFFTMAYACASAAITYVGIYAIHFALAWEWVPTYARKYSDFFIPKQHQLWFQNGTLLQPGHLISLVTDSISYQLGYHSGVPPYDPLDPNSTGSTLWQWFVGIKPIFYRKDIIDPTHIKYLILQCNPIIWCLGLLAVVVVASGLISKYFFKAELYESNLLLKQAFTLSFVYYCLLILIIPRVMYLYHYLPLLLIEFHLLAIVVCDLTHISDLTLTRRRKTVLLSFVVACAIATSMFFSPLTYAKPLTTQQLEQRQWIANWGFVPNKKLVEFRRFKELQTRFKDTLPSLNLDWIFAPKATK